MLGYIGYKACQSNSVYWFFVLGKIGILAWFLVVSALAVAKLDKIARLLEKKQ